MADLAAGTVLGGRFEVVGVLGRGGMATVYLSEPEPARSVERLSRELQAQAKAAARARAELAGRG